MERKIFLRSLMMAAASAPAVLQACKKDSTTLVDGSSETVTNTGSASGCNLAPTETEGPFPTKSPSSYIRSDIRADRTGHMMTANITITNSNNNCSAIEGAIVDIWHCDAQGNYSEYGGSGMQSINYQSVHFLRGRQITDSKGLVSFTTIFPGWYTGRATHIHVHVYNASGNSLKVTQIAFPEGTGSAVAAVNGYTKGMSGYTYNQNDNVFSDDTTGKEIAVVSGSTANGFVLAISFGVPA